MSTREHRAEIELAATPERVFAALVTPSAIRDWWGAERVIVVPREGGVWAAAWGADEDAPDYLTSARVLRWEPPGRLCLGDYEYLAASGPLPFEAELTTTFEVAATPHRSRLRVTQSGFPTEPSADEFYAACETGWRDTLEALRRHLEGEGL